MLLSETEKYFLEKDDFIDELNRVVFMGISNLFAQGIEKVHVIDLENYLKKYSTPRRIFEENDGVQYLYDAEDLAQEQNFKYYYDRVKKFTALRTLKKQGFSVTEIYDEEELNPIKLAEMQDRFDELELKDIFSTVYRKYMVLEDHFLGQASADYITAERNIGKLKEDLKESPEIGYPLQGEIFNTVVRGARAGKFYLLSGNQGSGKALPNSTLIPTPIGWRRVSEIEVGDFLFDAFGKPTEVLGVFPQGKKTVYEVEFKDGRTAKCCDEHLWSYCTKGQKEKARKERRFVTKSLKEIIKDEENNNNKKNNILVPQQYAVEYEEKKHFIPPYIFGLMLGDGSFRFNKANKAFTYSSADEELPKCIADEMEWNVRKNSKYNYNWTFFYNNPTESERRINVWVEDILEEHPELANLKSEDKFIPREYIEDSIENRFELLNGLLDSDGSVDVKGRVSYCTVSKVMIKQVEEIARSLGFVTTLGEDTHKKNICYTLQIAGRADNKVKLFKLARKKERIENWYNNEKRKRAYDFNPMVEIRNLGYEEEMTCFWVDNKESLFLTENFIVTHNSRTMIGHCCQLAYPYYYDENFGRWIYTKSSQKVLYISTEMDFDEVQTIILAYLSGVNEEQILWGMYNGNEEERVNKAIEIMEQYKDNLILNRIPNPSSSQIANSIKKHVYFNKIKYVFYDYIFTTPSLLNEFRDLKVREDVVLTLLSTLLKDLAVELGIFIMSGTQLNRTWEEKKGGIRNQNMIRGSTGVADKIDVGAISMPVLDEELVMLSRLIKETGLPPPTQVTDIYKARRSRYKNVRVWSQTDLGTARIRDLFMTDANYNVIKIDKVEIQIENDFNKIIETELEEERVKEEHPIPIEEVKLPEELDMGEEFIEEKEQKKEEIDLGALC